MAGCCCTDTTGLPASLTVVLTVVPLQETLLEAAGYFGAEAVAKCASLTVRKLYQREYHFFSPSGEGGKDVFVRMRLCLSAGRPAA